LTLPFSRGKVYLFRVVQDGYQEYNGREIIEIDTAFLTIPLTKAPFTVFVSVYNEDDDPVEGALVLVDNSTAGTTSRSGRAVLSNLTAGGYLLEVKHPGYVPARQPFTVAVQGEDITSTLIYRKENITIKTEEGAGSPVANVKIRLNGEEAGFTDDKGTLPVLMRVNLLYTITAEKEGYHQAIIEQEISPPNSTSSLVIPMNRNFNMMILGIAGLCVAVVLGVVLFLRIRSDGHSRGKRGGL
jgi:Carboxypeptidase regulatory-like domain